MPLTKMDVNTNIHLEFTNISIENGDIFTLAKDLFEKLKLNILQKKLHSNDSQRQTTHKQKNEIYRAEEVQLE